MLFDDDSEFSLEPLDPQGGLDEPGAFDELAEAVQLLTSADGTWTLHVTDGSGRSGVVGLAHGRVCYARVGRALGRDAFLEMMRWSRGSIMRQTRDAQPEDMSAELDKLLLEAYWHALEDESSEITQVGRTVEYKEHAVEVRSTLSPPTRARLAELAGIDGFVFGCAYLDGEAAMYMWDPDVRRTEVVLERARALFGFLEESLEAAGIGEWEHVTAHMGAQVHVVGVIEDVERRVCVHSVFARRQVNIALALFKIRQILEP